MENYEKLWKTTENYGYEQIVFWVCDDLEMDIEMDIYKWIYQEQTG